MTRLVTEIKVSIADFAVARGGTRLVTIGLGSCVAIALYAREHAAGGLAHIMLPHAALSQHTDSPGKFASTAVPHMLRQLRALGAADGFEARLAGGASMFTQLLPNGSVPLGTRNVLAARAACAAAGIPVIAEDTGGGHGRNVFFDLDDGSITIKSVAVGVVEL